MNTVLAAETGSGKTLAYLLPIVQAIRTNATPHSFPLGLIVVPNRSLSDQVLSVTRQLCEGICGDNDGRVALAVTDVDPFMSKQYPPIIVGTPLLVLEWLQKSNSRTARRVVFDEADLVLDAFHDIAKQ